MDPPKTTENTLGARDGDVDSSWREAVPRKKLDFTQGLDRKTMKINTHKETTRSIFSFNHGLTCIFYDFDRYGAVTGPLHDRYADGSAPPPLHGRYMTVT